VRQWRRASTNHETGSGSGCSMSQAHEALKKAGLKQTILILPFECMVSPSHDPPAAPVLHQSSLKPRSGWFMACQTQGGMCVAVVVRNLGGFTKASWFSAADRSAALFHVSACDRSGLTRNLEIEHRAAIRRQPCFAVEGFTCCLN